MFTHRLAADRGNFDHGWLQTHHTFSFADYRDPDHMGFRALRVINEDVVAPGEGFGMHPHRDMEIVTLVLSGALEHRDSLGHGEILRPGELQRMSAGKGILHSEFNPSGDEPVHLYQIWLLPDQKGLEPSYDQKAFDPAARVNRWQLVASPDGAEESLQIHQNAKVFLANIASSRTLGYDLIAGRHAWLQVLRGKIEAGGKLLKAGDGLAVSDERQFDLRAESDAEVLVFDLT